MSDGFAPWSILSVSFLDKCSKLNPSLFHITDVVVKAHIHLTNACYKSFRKSIENVKKNIEKKIIFLKFERMF